MGKLITLINITLDGFCDSQYVIADAEFHEFVHTLLAGTHTVAFGRGTFELFQTVWTGVLANPQSSVPQVKMARALNDIPKIAFSSTLQQTTWPNSRVEAKVTAEDINKWKANNDQNLLTIGSPGLVEELTRMDLVDEYYFSVQPVIAGGGNFRLFQKAGLTDRQSQKFVDSRQLASGVNILHYRKS